MRRPLDERAVLRTAQLGLVLAFGANLVSAAALLVAVRAFERVDACEHEPVAPVPASGSAATEIAVLAPADEPAPDEPAPDEPAPKDPAADDLTPEDPSADSSDARAGQLGPLSEAELAILTAAPEDPPPEQLRGMRDEVYGRHYLASDEWNPHLFHDSIRDRGGAYVGVGTDQAYLFAGWARAELVWAIDYDPMVRDLHRVYADLIREAKTPDELVALWRTSGRKRALRLLYELHPELEERLPLRTAYLRARIRVLRRLESLQARLRARAIPSWLTDQAQYDHVRGLVQAGRVRAMLVDLTGESGLHGIGEASKALGIPLRVLYLSNAEQYWKYGAQYRRNIAGLDLDEQALVLRTISSRKANGDYRYNVHVARDYQRQLGDPAIRQVYQFVDLRRLAGRRDVHFSVTGAAPDPEPAPGPGTAIAPASVAGGQD